MPEQFNEMMQYAVSLWLGWTVPERVTLIGVFILIGAGVLWAVMGDYEIGFTTHRRRWR